MNHITLKLWGKLRRKEQEREQHDADKYDWVGDIAKEKPSEQKQRPYGNANHSYKNQNDHKHSQAQFSELL